MKFSAPAILDLADAVTTGSAAFNSALAELYQGDLSTVDDILGTRRMCEVFEKLRVAMQKLGMQEIELRAALHTQLGFANKVSEEFAKTVAMEIIGGDRRDVLERIATDDDACRRLIVELGDLGAPIPPGIALLLARVFKGLASGEDQPLVRKVVSHRGPAAGIFADERKFFAVFFVAWLKALGMTRSDAKDFVASCAHISDPDTIDTWRKRLQKRRPQTAKLLQTVRARTKTLESGSEQWDQVRAVVASYFSAGQVRE